MSELMSEHTTGEVIDLDFGIGPHRLAPLTSRPIGIPRFKNLGRILGLFAPAGFDWLGPVWISVTVVIEVEERGTYLLGWFLGSARDVVVAHEPGLITTVGLVGKFQGILIHLFHPIIAFFPVFPTDGVSPIVILAVITVKVRVLVVGIFIRHHHEFRPSDVVAVDLEILLQVDTRGISSGFILLSGFRMLRVTGNLICRPDSLFGAFRGNGLLEGDHDEAHEKLTGGHRLFGRIVIRNREALRLPPFSSVPCPCTAA